MPQSLWDKRRPACQPDWTLTLELEFAGSPGMGGTVRWREREGQGLSHLLARHPTRQANTCPLRLSAVQVPDSLAQGVCQGEVATLFFSMPRLHGHQEF